MQIHAKSGRWRATIARQGGGHVHLGYFDEELDAAQAYDEADNMNRKMIEVLLMLVIDIRAIYTDALHSVTLFKAQNVSLNATACISYVCEYLHPLGANQGIVALEHIMRTSKIS